MIQKHLTTAILILFCLFLPLLCGCEQVEHKTIDQPSFGLQNNGMLDIRQIVLTDTATYISLIPAFERILIDTSVYIRAKGTKYPVIRSEELTLGEYFYILESRKDYFTLIFPPLPKGTKTIDFIASDTENGIKIWDIDVTGKPKAYVPDLPAAKVSSQPLPPFEMKIAKTRLHIHLTGLREGYDLQTPRLSIPNAFTLQEERVSVTSSSGHTYTFEFDLYATSCIHAIIDKKMLEVYLVPGEEADIYYDVTGFSKTINRYDTQPDIRYAAFDGKLAALNEQVNCERQTITSYHLRLYEDLRIADMTAAQCTSLLLQNYHQKQQQLEAAGLPTALKQLITANMKEDILHNMTHMRDYCRNTYQRAYPETKLSGGQPFPTPSAAEWGMLKEIGLNDPMCLYASGYTKEVVALSLSSIDIPAAIGEKEGLLTDIIRSYPAMSRALSMEIPTPEMEKSLHATSTSIYGEIYTYILNNEKEAYDRAMAQASGFTFHPTPEAPGAEALDEMVAAYKGRPVLIDYWATWCGPCLAAMETIKPIKDEIKSKGVVILYVAGTNSPKADWSEMLAEIKGDHYYLNKDQWEGIMRKYKSPGIPTYMIFDKTGRMTYLKTGYPGNDIIQTELAKVW